MYNVEYMFERRAVVAVVPYDKLILVGKKKADSEGMLAGQWHIPGETLIEDETDEAGLIRGMLEEASIKVNPGRYLGTHYSPKGTRVNWYECIPETTDVVAGSDLEEVKWVPFGEVMEVCNSDAIALWPQAVLNYFNQ